MLRHFRKMLGMFSCGLFLLAGCAGQPQQPTPTPAAAPTPAPARFEAADCMFSHPKNIKIDCGYLVVPEDRSQPDSPLIQLAVAIVRSTNSQPPSEPVVFLGGGPGGYTLEGLAVSAYSQGVMSGDQVYLDQRGAGYSEPSLNCPEVDEQSYQDLQQNLSLEESRQHALQAYQTCHDRLVKEGINLAAYTSAASAADVNDLRIALGYAQWNIYGVSYGTRLALTVMRDFPEGVRSVILDSVYPPQVDWSAESAGNLEGALNLLFERCAADSHCNAAYPELKTVFYETVTQLDANPLTLDMTRARTAQSFKMVLNGDRLISIIVQLLHNTEALPYLPQIITDLHAGRTPGAIQFFGVWSGDYLSEGVNLSVHCGEEVIFSSPQIVAAANAEVMPRLSDVFDQKGTFVTCASWAAKTAAAIENEPVVSDIPTLILAGDNDPAMPPAWGQLAAKTLSRSYYREFRWVGHGVYGAGLWRSCSRNIVRDFLANPLSEPDSTCLDDLKVYFVTD